jgi:hypothetical protein
VFITNTRSLKEPLLAALMNEGVGGGLAVGTALLIPAVASR